MILDSLLDKINKYIYIYHYFILLFLIINLLFYTLILLVVTIKSIPWFSTKQIHWARKCRGAQVNAPCRLWSHHVSSHLLSHGLITWSWLFWVTRVTGFSLLQNSYLPRSHLTFCPYPYVVTVGRWCGCHLLLGHVVWVGNKWHHACCMKLVHTTRIYIISF